MEECPLNCTATAWVRCLNLFWGARVVWFLVGLVTAVAAVGLMARAWRCGRCGHFWIPVVGLPMALLGLVSGYDPTDEATYSELIACSIMVGVVLVGWVSVMVWCAVRKTRVVRFRTGVSEPGAQAGLD